jgi:glutaredoxin
MMPPEGIPGLETVTLYTRAGCRLCDTMKTELERRGYRVVEVDIDTDPELVRRYGQDIPVVVRADGTELARHRLAPGD